DLRDAIEVTRAFHRWERYSCVESPGVKVEGQDELFYFTFLQDISESTEISHLIQQTSRIYTSYSDRLKKFQDHWRREKHLFSPNKIKGSNLPIG
ncbi:unnamed protein product, partial [Protopolystoma xenopodis]